MDYGATRTWKVTTPLAAGAKVPVNSQRMAPDSPGSGAVMTTAVKSFGKAPEAAVSKVVNAGVRS